MKRFIIFALSVTLFTLIFVSFSFLNKQAKPLTQAEKEAALSKLLGRQVNLHPSIAPTGDTTYKGKYVTFVYPKAAKIYSYKINGVIQPTSGLEQFVFDLDQPKLAFFMEVYAMPITVQGVTDIPDVRLRLNSPGTYLESDVYSLDERGLAFTKSDNSGVEKTAFFLKNGNAYSFSVQGNDKESVDNLFGKIVPTVKFL